MKGKSGGGSGGRTSFSGRGPLPITQLKNFSQIDFNSSFILLGYSFRYQVSPRFLRLFCAVSSPLRAAFLYHLMASE